MDSLLAKIEAPDRRKNLPDFRAGDVVRVHQRIREGGKERIQVFEGLVIAKKHGNGLNGTFTVRRVASGVGVERVYPMHTPNIVKIERIRTSSVRRAKLYYMRELRGKRAKLKGVEAYASWEEPTEVAADEEIVATEEENPTESVEASEETPATAEVAEDQPSSDSENTELVTEDPAAETQPDAETAENAETAA